MQAYIKSFSAFRTVLARDALSYDLCLDSVEPAGSSVTLVGQGIPRSFAGSWLVIDRNLFSIDQITPQDGRTVLQLLAPGDFFDRKLLYTAPAAGATCGDFIAQVLQENWIDQADGVYAMPYMNVSTLDNVPFIEPTLDDYGLFSLSDYIRLVRRLRGVLTTFQVQQDTMVVRILDTPTTTHSVVFNDGHSQLETAAYSKSGAAKITTIHPVAIITGYDDRGRPLYELDQNGEIVYDTQTQDWYLSISGAVTPTVPGARASGEWLTLTVRTKDDPELKAQEQFAKNAESHKLEFWSDRNLDVLDACAFRVYDEVLSSYISYKGRRSTDGRWFYRSGELATSMTEKLKGMMNA